MDQRQKEIEAELAALKSKRMPLSRKNGIIPSTKKGSQKTFEIIWKRNMPIKNKITYGN